MAKHFSAFIEDTAENDNAHAQPHEIDVLSNTSLERLGRASLKNIEVEQCGPEGCEIHAPLGKKNGFSTTRLLFQVEARDVGYPHEARFARCDRVAGSNNEFICVTERGGKTPRIKHLIFAANGNDLTVRQTYSANASSLDRPQQIMHFYRLPDSTLQPAA